MKNTKFRKRALLSSVAMLLVALVALGSATFAWFVANPTVTASGLSLSTQAAAGLSVASKTVKDIYTDANDTLGAFKSTTVLNATGTTSSYATGDDVELQPAAPYLTLSSGALTFGKIAAGSSAAKTASTSASFEDTAVYSENIYLKTSTTNSGDRVTVQACGVNITTTGSNAARAGVKVALVLHQGAVAESSSGAGDAVTASDSLIGIWKVGETGTGAVTGDDSKVWNGEKGLASACLVDATSGTYKTNGASQAISLVATTSTDANYITAYVYLDGENTGVFSDNVPALATLVSSIDIKFSTATSVSF